MFNKVHVFRVRPGQELLSEIGRYCSEHRISSAVIIGIIGSVRSARLNFLVELPGKYDTVDYSGPMEIVWPRGQWR